MTSLERPQYIRDIIHFETFLHVALWWVICHYTCFAFDRRARSICLFRRKWRGTRGKPDRFIPRSPSHGFSFGGRHRESDIHSMIGTHTRARSFVLLPQIRRALDSPSPVLARCFQCCPTLLFQPVGSLSRASDLTDERYRVHVATHTKKNGGCRRDSSFAGIRAFEVHFTKLKERFPYRH